MNRISVPILFALATCTALAGCASSGGSAPTAELQGEAQARLFQPDPGKAVIYLVRDRGDLWQFGVRVWLDGKAMGTTKPLTYFRWVVEPGKHVIVAETAPLTVLELSTEPGGMYYVWQDINSGQVRAPSQLQQVDVFTARDTIQSAVLLANP